ncbi:hypothetical protein JOB18_033667 [Solea senegalensis]|uniref:VWFA domain-containing protein n=1 Tax=Solea senegalensis TaxID=28829 RepID=A0AAV6PKI5_SOLSE|nr:hypothetical protein JOB18_033667 [Solea senegalensis]
MIRDLEVLPLRNGASAQKISVKPETPVATEISNEKNVCRITFSPNIVQQAKISTSGMLGDFLVRYDVQRDMGIGDIQNVVFVIDTSASMLGKKIRQTKDALFTILKDLRPEDHFNFISFSSKVKVWQPGRLVPVTPLTVRDAKKFIFTLVPSGGETFRTWSYTNTGLCLDRT